MRLVIAEQRDGRVNRATWEAIAAAQQAGSPVKVAVLGAGVDACAVEMGAADIGWLLTVGGGALILGLALAFGVVRTRGRKSAAAQAAQDRGTNAAYGRTPPR